MYIVRNEEWHWEECEMKIKDRVFSFFEWKWLMHCRRDNLNINGIIRDCSNELFQECNIAIL